MASAAAFAVGELGDWAVYTFTRRPFSQRILISSLIGAPLDSIVFLGMGRLGFSEEELPQVIDKIRSVQGLEPVLAISHLSCADVPEQEAYTAEQAHRFAAMTDALRQAFPEMERSLANTAGTIALPEAHYEVCRPGISLYGGNPFTGTAWEQKGAKLGLEWAMLAVWGKVDLSKLRRPSLLTDEDWQRLYDAADVVARAPIFIDDTPALTTLELRARTRRLKADKGLGLVVVDYLQLMTYFA